MLIDRPAPREFLTPATTHFRPSIGRWARGLGVLLVLWMLGGLSPAMAQEEGGAIPCVDGMLDGLPCQNVTLLDRFSTVGFSAVEGIAAWTDPVEGTEYAIVPTRFGTLFVDISDPTNPVRIAEMPYAEGCCVAFPVDVVVYDDHAFIVGFQGEPGRETQIFDLGRLRDVVSPPVELESDATFSGFRNTSRVSVNPDTGFLYVSRADSCGVGVQMVDVSNPLAPVNAGCLGPGATIQSVQCVLYQGPDATYQGREMCFVSETQALSIHDVTDKTNPVEVSRTEYAGAGRAEVGSLTEDHAFFLLPDSADEIGVPHATRTYLWNLADLDAPTVGHYDGFGFGRDIQNLVRGQYVYQSNGNSGVRILDLHRLAEGMLDERAYLDLIASTDSPALLGGAPSDLALTDSGRLLVGTRTSEFLILEPDLCSDPAVPTTPTVQTAGGNTLQVDWSGPAGVTYNVYRSAGTCPGTAGERVASGLTAPTFTDTVGGQLEHSYVVTAVDATGACESVPSGCASATATGACNAPPLFDGLVAVENPEASRCRTELTWDPATPRCGSSVRYAVYRGETPDFEPSADNLLATALTDTNYFDNDVAFGETRYYTVRALDTFNGQEDDNTVALPGSPVGPAVSMPWTAGAEPGDPLFGGLGGPPSWETSTDRMHTGTASYVSGDPGTVCSSLVSPPLRLTAGEAPMLTFWTGYEFTIRFSGGVVEVSNDGGESWIHRQPIGGYPWSFLSGNVCGFGSQLPAYTGIDFGWQEDTFILTPWAGQEILIRWVFSSPPAGFDGWWVDTIEVSHVDQPQACAPWLFGDGFEAGNTSAWTSTSP